MSNPNPSKVPKAPEAHKAPKAPKASKYRKHKNRKNKHGEYRVTKQKKPNNEEYVYVAKGDVYVTSNCAKLAKEKGHMVYIVVSFKGARIGIQVPKEIYKSVREMEVTTREKRAKVVAQRESRIITLATKCLNGMFKQMPPGLDMVIIQRAFEKYSGRVGRTQTKSLPQRLLLATIAHIRHKFTSYDSSLSQWQVSHNGRKVPNDVREQLRGAIRLDIKKVWIEWGAVEHFGANLNKKTVKDYVPDEEECEMDIDVKGDGEENCDGSDSEDEDETDEDEMEEEEWMVAGEWEATYQREPN
ncbi:hypothetical protein RUND412_003194 [Rhizina undulata]